MLVLSRKPGERIIFPQQNILVTILEVRGDRVRLGIEAPSDIPVYRQEIWQRLQDLGVPEAVEAARG